MFSRRIKLPQTLDGLESAIKKFLVDNKLPVNQAYIGMTASFIQQSADGEDSFDPKALAKRIRRQVANEAAYYIIYPHKREEYEKARAESDAKKLSEATDALEQKTS